MPHPTKVRRSKAIDALPPLVTTAEASKALGISHHTLAHHARRRKFPGARLFGGLAWAIPKQSLLAYYGLVDRPVSAS